MLISYCSPFHILVPKTFGLTAYNFVSVLFQPFTVDYIF